MATTPSSSPERPVPQWPGQAGEIVRLGESLAISEQARSLVTPTHNVSQCVDLLRRNGLASDAIQVLAHWLPRRAGVSWTCRCVRAVLGEPRGGPPDAALEAAERWAAEPSEEHRRAASAAAETANYETPGACAALAAFWSEGSLAPSDARAVLAPPHLAPRSMANALQLAAVRGDPEQAGARRERFLDVGLAVAQAIGREPAAVDPTT